LITKFHKNLRMPGRWRITRCHSDNTRTATERFLAILPLLYLKYMYGYVCRFMYVFMCRCMCSCMCLYN
jgi:hypothetical protein